MVFYHNYCLLHMPLIPDIWKYLLNLCPCDFDILLSKEFIKSLNIHVAFYQLIHLLSFLHVYLLLCNNGLNNFPHVCLSYPFCDYVVILFGYAHNKSQELHFPLLLNYHFCKLFWKRPCMCYGVSVFLVCSCPWEMHGNTFIICHDDNVRQF